MGSSTEDYLDGLLNSLDGKGHKDVEPEQPVEAIQPEDELFATEPELMTESKDAEQDFLDSFERELLSGEDAEEFIRQFELELEQEDALSLGNANVEDMFLENLDSDTAGVEIPRMDMPETADIQEEDALDFMVDTLGDISDTGLMFDDDTPQMDVGESVEPEGIESEDTPLEEDFGMPLEEDFGLMGEDSMLSGDLDEPLPGLDDIMSGGADALDDLGNEDQDLMDLLQSEGDFSDIGSMLNDNGDGMLLDDDDLLGELGGLTVEEVPINDSMILEEQTEEKGKKRRRGKKQKDGDATGFLQKISQALFGDDEEEKAAAPAKAAQSAPPKDIEDFSDDNLAILQALEGGAAAEEVPEKPKETEDPKEKKKREKKEKKAKKKKEREEKKALAKAAKAAKAEQKSKKAREKKPKKPKEPDNTPPLPKKPVILIFIMAGSFLALVLIGTNLVGYSNSMSGAKQAFDLGDYEAAYQEVAGLEIKEEDVELYEKYRVMGTVAGEYEAYQTFMEAGVYDMALDSLVRTVGRCEKYKADAELYGCTAELERLHEQATGALGSFGLTEQRALELYAIDEREEYSAELNAIVEQAGFTLAD